MQIVLFINTDSEPGIAIEVYSNEDIEDAMDSILKTLGATTTETPEALIADGCVCVDAGLDDDTIIGHINLIAVE
jgi:hypothetical protein